MPSSLTLLLDLCRESVEGHYVPNAGFLEDAVFEDPSYFSSDQPSDSSKGGTDGSDSQRSGICNENIDESVDVNYVSERSAASAQNDSGNATGEITKDVSDLKLTDNVVATELNSEQHSLSTENVDSHLDRCLLQALHTTVKDKDLPMLGSTLW